MKRKTFLSDGVRICIICIEDWIKFYRTLAGTSCPWVEDTRAGG